jgi:hypothetical protein
MPSHVPQSPVSPDSSTTSTKKKRIQPQGRLRCRSRNRKGTRCRLQCDPAIGRCLRHRLRPAVFTDDADLSLHFSGKLEEFRSATQINDFLTVLIRLVVANEISARRAAVIGYLTSQLRHTLPEIAAEQAPPEPRYIIDVPRPGCPTDDDADPNDSHDPAESAAQAEVIADSAQNSDPPTATPSVGARQVVPVPVTATAPDPAVATVAASKPPTPPHHSPPNPDDGRRSPAQPVPHFYQPGFANPHLSGPAPNLDKLFPADPFSVPLPRRKTLRAPRRHANQVSRLDSDDPFDWSPD